MRSDEQLVALFRAGHDEAFRAIHDRYRQRLFAYTRQMLPGRQDAEDALQDVFVRAYRALRSSNGELVLRAWLYRIAHNRCIDELRRPAPPPPEVLELVRTPAHDPIAAADQRESLRRLVVDVRRLPEQQRSALLMRELGGMAYADMATALGVSVPAVKSLLVRARIALGQALEARDTACCEIRDQLTVAHDRGVRPSGTARRHMRDCSQCRHFHRELRGLSRRFAAIAPTVGPLGLLAKVLGVGGGAGGGAAASSGAIAAGGAAGTGGAIASVGLFATGTGHIAALIAAAAMTAGGAVELQSQIAPPRSHHHRAAHAVAAAPVAPAAPAPAAQQTAVEPVTAPVQTVVIPQRQPSTVQVAPPHKTARHHKKQLTHGTLGSPTTTGSQTPASGGASAPSTTSTTTGENGAPSDPLDGSTKTTGTTDTGKPVVTNPTSALDTTSTSSSGNGTTQSSSSSTTSSTGSTAPVATQSNTASTGSSGSAPVTAPVGNGA